MKTVYAKDWGIEANVSIDFTAHFQKMFKANPNDTMFILESGSYHFWSQNAIKQEYYLSNTTIENPRKLALLLQDMNHVILDANNSEFIFHGQIMPITIDTCSNIIIKNLKIDWEIPLTAEGVVLHSNESYVDISIDHNLFPHKVEHNELIFIGENWESKLWDWSITEFDCKTKKVAYRSGDTFPKTWQERLDNGHVRCHGEFKTIPKVGNLLVLRHNERIHAGIFIVDSNEISLDNISIYNTGGLGILAQFSHNLSFRQIKIIPNISRGRRITSGHDDGIHLSCNSGHITVENCYFYGLMDDPLNIHGIATRILKKENKNILMGEFAHPQSQGFHQWALQGHKVAFIKTDDMSQLFILTVKDYKLISKSMFVIEFEEEVPDEIKIGYSMENITRTASITCSNNFFGNCRARGILISTPKTVLIENNIFESAGAAILIAGDANYWYESGNCNDVLIRNNHFSESCLTSSYLGGDAVISIHPEVGAPCKEKPFHKNIRIENNSFQTADYPVVYAFCTKGILFSENRIIRSYLSEPWNRLKHMLTFEYCSEVTVQKNRLIGEVLGQNIALKEMELNDLILDDPFDLDVI